MNLNLIKAAVTALILLLTVSLIYALKQEPQVPSHVIVEHNGTIDVWTYEHIHQEGDILYIQE